MMEINERQMKLGYYARCVAVILRLAMEDDFDFVMTVKPINKDAELLKTVRVLCDKTVDDEEN